MTWALAGFVAIVALSLGAFFRRRRRISPAQDFGERLRRSQLAADLAERAGTMDEVRLLVERGDKIAAVKALRAQTNCGLREAKGAVEALERELRATGV